MIRSASFLSCFAIVTSLACCNPLSAADGAPGGLGDPGALEKITLDTGRDASAEFIISGRDARDQLVVTGHYATKQVRDLTRKVAFTSEPAGIVEIDATGHVAPIKEGQAKITAKEPGGKMASVSVKVTNIAIELPINFPNQIGPIFTKYGCNSGGCHGKSGGQNGFALSLLGFVPKEDYEHLVKEGRGRRLFPAAPDRSLLLQKAAGIVPHGGGSRLDVDSHEYRLLRRWIAQGMPYGGDNDPVITKIEVFPRQVTMDRNAEQQITVIAHYSDGHTEDVTRTAQFDPNNPEMAEASNFGLVKTAMFTGDVAVMARYLGQVGVFRATIPLGAKVENLPPAKNYIDTAIYAKLKVIGIPPSPICDDATFLRRTANDIAGRLPTREEAEQFLVDKSADKRARWVDKLLASTDYADYFANKWSSVLRNKRRQTSYKHGTFAFHAWIRDSLHNNKPYDEFVRDIVAAKGEIGQHPPVAWYREVNTSSQQLEDTAQLFLGLRIQCARCHHHPFEKWSQDDYYGFAAFFSRVGKKKGEQAGEDRIFHRRGVASATNPTSKNNLKPTGLGSPPMKLSPDDDPREALVDWMAAKDNPFFAHALVNRYWKHFFGRGLVDPEDDMRATNPATNPELLQALAKHFIDSKFDMKQLIRTIVLSNTYQFSAEPNAYNAKDKQNFSRYYPKRLHAEVLLDSINALTMSTTPFSGLPAGTRAVQLPDRNFNSYFLTVFGAPESSSACECERSSEANLAQSLHLLNSSEVQGKLTNGSGRAAKLAKDKERTHKEKIRELYLVAFSREPDQDEYNIAGDHIKKKGEKVQEAYEDIVWALINTKEFLFNH
ncbi:MAG: DUF1553 domain-containing protein [Planctomycetes bacterium]|nr:DUF1553 domain-containing protein [Planctomycetota bacterium]